MHKWYLLNGSVPVILSNLVPSHLAGVVDVPVGQSLLMLLILHKGETNWAPRRLKVVLAIRPAGFRLTQKAQILWIRALVNLSAWMPVSSCGLSLLRHSASGTQCFLSL